MQKSFLLCLYVCLCGTLPGFGQGRDTAFAVHKLFREKRAAGKGLEATGATTGTKYAQRPNGRPTAQEARQDALGNTVFTGVGMFKKARYSAEREAFILKQYAAGGSIPPDVRRKLHRKYFHRTAQDLMATD